MAAMLLTSVCAFAQNSEPLEGDVNKDGVVDVADIVKVIDIIAAAEQPQTTTYYWYAGTTLPTESNLSSICTGSTTSKPTTWTAADPQSISATNNTGESCYIYYCFPTNWNVVVLDQDKVSEVLLANVTTFTLDNIEYTVLRTGRLIGNGTTKPYYAIC